MKNIILTIVLMIAGWIQTRIKTKLDFYLEVIGIYQSKQLFNNSSSQMDMVKFRNLRSDLNEIAARNRVKLSVLAALILYVRLIKMEVGYMKELDELERSVSTHQLIAYLFS
jgi:hypothetical protein